MPLAMDWLTTDSTIFVGERCEFRLDMAGDEAVLRISAGAAQCHLVLSEGVAERIKLLLTEALSHGKPKGETCYMVVPIHPRSIPDPNLSGGNSAGHVLYSAIR